MIKIQNILQNPAHNTMVQERFVPHRQEKVILPVSGRKASFLSTVHVKYSISYHNVSKRLTMFYTDCQHDLCYQTDCHVGILPIIKAGVTSNHITAQ